MKGTALVTGGAKRIGEAICRALHAEGWRVLVHCYRSCADGERLVTALNALQGGSAALVRGDLATLEGLGAIVADTLAFAPDLSLLVNNAAAYFPTPVGRTSATQWDELVNANLRAPFFVAQGLHQRLSANGGSIVNLADIYAERPPRDHAVYAMTKAGIVAMTRALARDLAPAVRVNAVAPGAILWPEESTEAHRQQLLARIPLQRAGDPADIARAVVFLATQAPYMTGQVIAIDGGRSLNM